MNKELIGGVLVLGGVILLMTSIMKVIPNIK